MGNINVTGPDEAVIVSGGCCGGSAKKYKVHGWLWSWAMVTNVERLNLNVMTLKPTCTSVETSQGVPLTVTGVAQVKVMYGKGEKQILERASQHFVGRDPKEIQEVLCLTLEGHLRAITGQLTVKQIYQDREAFAHQVRETAMPDLGKMGIQIVSFVVQDIRDDVDYLSSIGRAQTAVVIKSATIGTNDALRDAKITEAQCEQEVVNVTTKVDAIIDNSKKNYKTVQAECNTKIQKAQTEGALAYDLQKALEEQVIRQKELQVEVIRRRKAIEVEEFEVSRKEKELLATERLPAKYRAEKTTIVAEGKKTAAIFIAEAQAERIRLLGQAEADAIRATGEATAKAMKMKAEAMQEYGREALVQMVLESLPSLAAEISAPLSKIDEIVILGDPHNATGEMGKLLSECPAVVKALTGVDVHKVVKHALPVKK